MAHGLERASDMAYNSQNGAPWHSLGVAVPGLMTAQEVADLVPRFVDPVVKVPAVHPETGAELADHFYTLRSDDRTVLGHVGPEFTVYQNLDMLRDMEKICQDPNGPRFETVGLLWDGRKSWVLAKFPDDLVIRGRNGKEDRVAQYLLGSNAHDASQRVRFQATPVRVVCQNTLNLAHRGATRQTSAWVCHSGDVKAKVANVAALLGIVAKDFQETKELYQALVTTEPTKEQIASVLETLIPATESKRSELQRGRVLALAAAGRGNADFEGTAWALYQGYTELVDHHNNQGSKRSDAQDMRVNSNWFGSGMASKRKALQTIASVCLN